MKEVGLDHVLKNTQNVLRKIISLRVSFEKSCCRGNEQSQEIVNMLVVLEFWFVFGSEGLKGWDQIVKYFRCLARGKGRI